MPTGSVIIDNDGKALKASCPDSEVFADHPVGKCRAEESKTAVCVGFESAENLVVATGTITAAPSGTLLNVELPASVSSSAFRHARMVALPRDLRRIMTFPQANCQSCPGLVSGLVPVSLTPFR